MLNPHVTVKFSKDFFWGGGGAIFMQIRQKYLNASLCKFVIYSLRHSETFDVSHVFLPLTIAELSMLKQVRFFLVHPAFSALYPHHNCTFSEK